MKLVKRIALGIFIYVVFLVVLFPASVAVKLAPIPSNIVISGVSGTIWSGSIDLLTIQKRQVEMVHWDLNISALFTGTAEANISIGNRSSAVNGKGVVAYSADGLDVSGLRFEAPSSFILGKTKLPFKTKVSGDISALIDTYTQGIPWCEQLAGKLFLNTVKVTNQFGHYPLGDIALGLSCIDGNVQLATDEKSNDLGLDGSIVLVDKKMMQLNAKIREVNTQPEDLKKALSFLGKKDSQGYYAITYQGRLPI
ncbi:type II secretion system protein N [Shewanella youngdeokensis]|uniref:Type II secretion system protein N n=1 Tax=Shewanella youngdeokensis TaxID=2999068 RepID=A0ABZ0JYC8_9GAMM|nr:type II secretion system protein N [Shewanella sp. DAU334]